MAHLCVLCKGGDNRLSPRRLRFTSSSRLVLNASGILSGKNGVRSVCPDYRHKRRESGRVPRHPPARDSCHQILLPSLPHCLVTTSASSTSDSPTHCHPERSEGPMQLAVSTRLRGEATHSSPVETHTSRYSGERGNPARAKKLESSVVEGRRARAVGCIALWNKEDHPLPSSRQNYSIRILEVGSPRLVNHRLPLCTFEGLVDPHTILVVEVPVPTCPDPIQFKTLDRKLACHVL